MWPFSQNTIQLSDTPNVMTDPLMQPIIQGLDDRMNGLVSGFNDTVNLGVGAAALAVGTGAAVGVTALTGALSNAVPYNSNHISGSGITGNSAVDNTYSVTPSANDPLAANAVTSDTMIAPKGLPLEALAAVLDVKGKFGGQFDMENMSKSDIGEIVPTAQRDGAAEQKVRVHDSALGAAA